MKQIPTDLFEDLPGAERVLAGLRDFHAGRHSIPACLVRMARPRLIKAGMMTAALPHDDGAELDLYQLVSSTEGPRAFSRYNALVRELVSFEHALDHRMAGGVPQQAGNAFRFPSPPHPTHGQAGRAPLA
jgi:hypothetical protein